MCSVYNYYVNPKGYGKFIYHVKRTIYRFDKISAKGKISENGVIITLFDKSNSVNILVPFDTYNKIVEALTLGNYSALCILQFDRFILAAAFNEFYSSKFI